jgi:nitrogen regulatory protein PII
VRRLVRCKSKQGLFYNIEPDFFHQNLLRIVDDVISVIKASIELWPTLVEICYFQKGRRHAPSPREQPEEAGSLKGDDVKLIIAVVQTDKLSAIQEALHEPDAYVMYANPVGDVRESVLSTYRGLEYRQPRPRIRLEVVVVNDLLVQETIDVIAQAAYEPTLDHISNGSIFVMPLDEWIRIPANRPIPVEGIKKIA